MATRVAFPAGMTTVTVTGTLSSLGRSRPGTVRVYAERKFGYAGTDWIMDEASAPVPLVSGRFALPIPHSNQFGLIGDNNGAITNVGYKIVFQPLQSGPAEVLAWTLLPTSLGSTIAFSKLGNLGGWPNATTYLPTTPTSPTTPTTPTDTSHMVEISPGVFRKV